MSTSPTMSHRSACRRGAPMSTVVRDYVARTNFTGWLLAFIAAGSAIMGAVVLVEAASALGGPGGSMGIVTVIIGGTMQLLLQAVAGTAMALLCFAAARSLGVGDNRERIRSEAAFAKLCGACPVPASSGKTNRQRLNRGGSRKANAALYRVVVTRLRSHQPTLDYVRRRTSEGKNKADIIRCLKRYVAREIHGYLCAKPRPFGTASSSP